MVTENIYKKLAWRHARPMEAAEGIERDLLSRVNCPPSLTLAVVFRPIVFLQGSRVSCS